MNQVDQHVGMRLHQLRLESGVSLERLAAAAGIDEPAMTACEAGERRVSAEEMMLICTMLDIRPRDVFEGYKVEKAA